MKLLGDWNWWLPGSLSWMPQIEREREVQPATRRHSPPQLNLPAAPLHGGRRSFRARPQVSAQGALGGLTLMNAGVSLPHDEAMPCFLLHHSHEPRECGAAFAAWRGFTSELRHRAAASTCLVGGHAIWWRVQAADPGAALALLPPYVANRTIVIEIREVRIP